MATFKNGNHTLETGLEDGKVRLSGPGIAADSAGKAILSIKDGKVDPAEGSGTAGSPSAAARLAQVARIRLAGGKCVDSPSVSGTIYWGMDGTVRPARADGAVRTRASGSAKLKAEEAALMAEDGKIMAQIKSLRARREEIAIRLADLPGLIDAAVAAEEKADAETAAKAAEKTIKSEAAAMAALAKVAKMIPADKLAAMLAAMSAAPAAPAAEVAD